MAPGDDGNHSVGRTDSIPTLQHPGRDNGIPISERWLRFKAWSDGAVGGGKILTFRPASIYPLPLNQLFCKPLPLEK